MTITPIHFIPDDLYAAIFRSLDRSTAYGREGWTPENPWFGHCAIVALIIQDRLGGEIVRGEWSSKQFGSHYWVESRDVCGTSWIGIDPSWVQFPKGTPRPDIVSQIERDTLVENPDTNRRYRLLDEMVTMQMGLGNQRVIQLEERGRVDGRNGHPPAELSAPYLRGYAKGTAEREASAPW